MRQRINIFLIFFSTILTLSCQHSSKKSEVDYILIPQWHLGALDDTKAHPGDRPQSENQISIFNQLSSWIEGGEVQNIIVEGCEGEIAHGFKERFNGWSLDDLEKLDPKTLEPIMTHVGLKIEAKYAQKSNVICGDDLALVSKHQLILSDLRGLLGFKTRIQQFKNESQKLPPYLKKVRELLKIPPNTNDTQVLDLLNAEIQKEIAEFEMAIKDRNASFIRVAKKMSKPVALVIGALHIEGIKKSLGDEHLSVSVYPSKGLKGDEANVLNLMKSLVNTAEK